MKAFLSCNTDQSLGVYVSASQAGDAVIPLQQFFDDSLPDLTADMRQKYASELKAFAAKLTPAVSHWQTGRPPNETLVEVERDGKILRVMAFFGRDGYRPHWTTENRDATWPVDAFSRWREIV